MLLPNAIPLALYVHIPWCAKKCPYCDFNSHQIKAETLDEDAYIAALLDDLQLEQEHLQCRAISSIFIGGGTPSLFSGTAIATLLQGIQAQVSLTPDVEITLEANPGSADAANFTAYRDAGVNRLSLGIQSFQDSQLTALGRIHTVNMAELAIERARAAGFSNLNLDLMFGLPGQSQDAMLQDLSQAMAYQPEHLSWYQLTLEPNTAFYQAPPNGLPDVDAQADMAEAGLALLTAANYERYEVSAFAREQRHAQHNLNYWYFGDYLGIGAGAHGKITHADGSIWRYAKQRQPVAYMHAVRARQPQSSTRQLQHNELPIEFMMNALRLTQGFTSTLYSERTGMSLASIQPQLDGLIQSGLLVDSESQIQPTELGMRFLNSLLERFM